jgi:hypothetical protein
MKEYRFRFKKKLFLAVILMLIGGAGCNLVLGIPDYIPNEPQYYRADFDRVWNAAIYTLDDLGYVIIQMRKEDGYISTDIKDHGRWRNKIRIRLSSENNLVKVTINGYYEDLKETTRSDGTILNYWVERKGTGSLEQMIKDEIASRL